MKKELKLIKTTHNGERCYKDPNKLFMVVKSNDGKRWRLLKAIPYNNNSINESKAWGYEELDYFPLFSSLKEVITEINYLLKKGSWWDDFQRQLRDEYLD